MNLNPIDFDYVDGLNTYPIIDYFNENITSNISNNNIYINQNITSNITSNNYSCNVSLNNNQKLNNSLYFSTSNLIIDNSNNFGEIRFKTSYNYTTSNSNFGTIIDYTGKLQVYHNYNLLQPLFYEGYYDVEGELLGLKADGISTDIQLTALEAGAVAFQGEIISLTEALNLVEGKFGELINNFDTAKNIEELRDLNKKITYGETTAQYADIILNLRNGSTFEYNTAFLNGFALSVGLAFAGGAISAASSYLYYKQASNALFINSNISSNDKYTIYSNNTSNEVSSYSNFNFSSSNLALFNGFLNSNTIAQQYLNSLRTNELKIGNTNISNIFVSSNVANEQLIQKLRTNQISLNFKTITKFSLDALEDWIRTPNGIYYDITNGNLGVSATPNINDFLIVGGQTTIQGNLITETKMKFTNTNYATPQLGINGGNGDRLIFKSGAVSVYPYSIGTAATQLWYSVPAGATHNFYVNGGTAITSISSTGLSTTGLINASTNLQEAGTNLTAKYLRLNGASAMTGTLNGTTINASTNLQENAVNLSSKYLKLDGTNVMTGQITGITTLSATTGLFGKLQTTNNTNVGAPSFGVSGGTGDKLVFYAGSVSAHPYSLGINTNQLWYSVPSWASNNFYVGGTSIASISSTGILTTQNMEISKGNPTLTLRGSYQDQIATLYLATPFTPSTSLKTAIISQGITSWGKSKLHFCLNDANENTTNVDYTHARMTIEPAGNVGIGTHTPNSSFLLHIYSSGTNNAIQAIDASGGTGQASLRLIAGSGITPTNNRATRIDFYNNVASSSVARWTLINDYQQNGTNDFRLVNAANTSTITILQNGNIGIGITNPFAPLCIGNPITTSDGFLVLSRKSDTGARNFKIGLNTNFNFTIGDFGNAVSGNTWRDTDFTIRWGVGYVGIGTSSVNNILQVGNGARLRISNGISDFTLIGTNTDDDNLNTRIVLSGNSRSIYAGNIEYIATAGSHLFLTNGTNERMRIRNNGDLIKPGYIYAGGDETNGGLRIGSDGYINFYQPQKLIGSLPAHINSVLRDDNSFKFQSQSTTSPFGYIELLDMNINGGNFSVPVKAPTFICTGETYSYTTNWNSSGQSGWFVPLNRYWGSGHAYLTCAIYLVNANGKNEYCWFGRIFLSTSGFGSPPAVNGGVILISTDLRNPSTISTNNYYIYVNELTAGGVNALFIQVNNTFYAGTIKVKIYG